MRSRFILLTLVAGALCLPATGSSRARDATLVGTVGPGYTITLVDSSGNDVSHLDPGTYTLTVHDLADIHDFHLQGPGVDVATDVSFVGDKTFTITLQNGSYMFKCDPHESLMGGGFTVGSGTSTAPPTTTAPKKPVVKKPVHKKPAHKKKAVKKR